MTSARSADESTTASALVCVSIGGPNHGGTSEKIDMPIKDGPPTCRWGPRAQEDLLTFGPRRMFKPQPPSSVLAGIAAVAAGKVCLELWLR